MKKHLHSFSYPAELESKEIFEQTNQAEVWNVQWCEYEVASKHNEQKYKNLSPSINIFPSLTLPSNSNSLRTKTCPVVLPGTTGSTRQSNTSGLLTCPQTFTAHSPQLSQVLLPFIKKKRKREITLVMSDSLRPQALLFMESCRQEQILFSVACPPFYCIAHAFS